MCPPENKVTWQQVADIGIKYLEEHPEARHLPADDVVLNALKETFPCN
jgi:hypothetical protein